MKASRRQFLKIGGIGIAASGVVPAFLASCNSETGQPLLPNMVEGIEPISDSDYETRIEKLVNSLIEFDIDAVFIEGSTNLKYFFNMSWWLSERTFGAIVNTKGTTIWICPAFELERAKEQLPTSHSIRTWEEHESPFKLFADILKELGLSDSRVGVGPMVRSFIAEGFRREFPSGIVDGSMAVNSVRAIKTEKELLYMDLANNITKKAYKYAFDKLEAGMSSSDIGGMIREAHSAMGTSGSGGPLIGFTSAFPHGTRQNKKLENGDILLVDGGCSIEGFRSDITRTIVFGTPSDKQKKVFDAVLKAQQAAHNAVRPGVKCGDIDNAARKVIDEAGFGPEYKYFAHRLGHGIGMDGHEYPYLVKGNDLELKPGMTFSNEPGIYIYGEFGVRIEDCFVVTDDGAKMLGGMLTMAIDEPFGG